MSSSRAFLLRGYFMFSVVSQNLIVKSKFKRHTNVLINEVTKEKVIIFTVVKKYKLVQTSGN